MITNFEKLKALNKMELAEWLDTYGEFDHSPWIDWFDCKYCKKCEAVKARDNNGIEHEFSFCELNDKCFYFDKYMNNIDIIKEWFEANDE